MIDTVGMPMPKDAPAAGTCVRMERPEAGLVVLVLDPPHRTLPVFDLPMLRDLELCIAEVERDTSLTGLVITGRTTAMFAAGADIDALFALREPALVVRLVEMGQKLFERIARLSKREKKFTSVAAIGGAAPGGALELALACDFIVATDARETRLGLPETQLGILPAWGGCQRLPRKIGVPRAMQAILTGRLYSSKEGQRLGIVDRVVHAEDMARIAANIAMGREIVTPKPRRMARLFVDHDPLATRFIARQAKKEVLKKTRGHYPAPLLALEILARAPHTPIEKGFADEARAASELAVGDVAKNLITIFRLSEEAKKLSTMRDGTRAAAPERVGVLGAGVMGRGIASLSAERGLWVRLFDIAAPALDASLIEHRAGVMEKRKKRRLESYEANAAIDRLDATSELVGFKRTELVIEAVAEKLEIKHALFAKLASQVSDRTVLATNTSSLSVDAIARGIPHPERVVGLHFFNPVKKMPLVEIIKAPQTEPWVVSMCAAYALKLGKTPVVVKDVAGFLVNRLLGPYLDEALRLLAAGVDPARMERAVLDFGMPMGPLALLDEVGFDIAEHAAMSLVAAYGPRMAPSNVLAAFVRAGRLGKKSGTGFYQHSKERGERPVLSMDLATLLPDSGAARAQFASDHEIAERLILAMVNEAARALEESVVQGPRELDLASVFGMGFPPFRGGMLRYADTLGAKKMVDLLERMQDAVDVRDRPEGIGRARFEPAPSLVALARSGRSFHG